MFDWYTIQNRWQSEISVVRNEKTASLYTKEIKSVH